jgi:hypothetical protein
MNHTLQAVSPTVNSQTSDDTGKANTKDNDT